MSTIVRGASGAKTVPVGLSGFGRHTSFGRCAVIAATVLKKQDRSVRGRSIIQWHRYPLQRQLSCRGRSKSYVVTSLPFPFSITTNDMMTLANGMEAMCDGA